MSEEKNKKEEKKDDCPLCSISPETIAALKKAKAKNTEKKEEKKQGLTQNK